MAIESKGFTKTDVGPKPGKKDWIGKMDMKEGDFSAKAKKAGMSTAEYARAIMDGEISVDAKTKKQASLALTFSKMKK